MYISGPGITISLTGKTQDHVLIAGFARKWHLYMCFILFWHMRIKELEFFLFKLIEYVNWNVLILFCCFHDQKALQLVILLKICFKSLGNPDGEYFDQKLWLFWLWVCIYGVWRETFNLYRVSIRALQERPCQWH